MPLVEVQDALPNVHAGPSHSSNHTANDQSVCVRSGSADCATNFKCDDKENDKPLDVESAEEFTDKQDDGDGTHGKANADPGQFLDLTEVLIDRGLDIGGDGGVKACLLLADS
jgi:hypothetical protein